MSDLVLDAQLRYDNVRAFFAARYADLDLKVLINQGPDTDTDLDQLSVDRMLFIMIGGGPGLSNDGMSDRVTLRLRWVGPQGSYDAAEAMAMGDDRALLSASEIGGVRVDYIVQQGGRPTLLQRGSGDRYHFTCSYITETASGL
jgi:hypothetical protein